jgi:hypothetical protein
MRTTFLYDSKSVFGPQTIWTTSLQNKQKLSSINWQGIITEIGSFFLEDPNQLYELDELGQGRLNND